MVASIHVHGRISLLRRLLPSKRDHSSSFSRLHATHFSNPPRRLSSFVTPISIKPRFLILRSLCTQYARLNSSSTTVSSLHCVDLSSPYLSVRILCQKLDADALSEALLCFGANSAYMDDLTDYEDLDEICITSIFPEGENIEDTISNAASSINLEYKPKFEVSIGEQSDWVAKAQESFKANKVTEGLWIVPSWREAPDLKATNIILNPGLAFGTGEHATTKLCLLLLHKIIKGGEHIFDYGIGSGILSIASLKMGAELCVGIDIDPIAITSTRENSSLNDIHPDKLLVYLVSNQDKQDLESRKGNFDVVIANILLNPLIYLAGDIISYGKTGSIFGLSGILTEQVKEIEEIYSKYLDNVSISEMDGWACLCGVKK